MEHVLHQVRFQGANPSGGRMRMEMDEGLAEIDWSAKVNGGVYSRKLWVMGS